MDSSSSNGEGAAENNACRHERPAGNVRDPAALMFCR